MEDGTAGRWLDVNSAADELGVSTDAVRKRISRGTLRSNRKDGAVQVWLDDGGTEAGREAQVDGGALVEVLKEQAEYLREQLAEEREARRRADTIIAQLTQANAALAARVPELEAPSETRDEPETVEEEPEEPEGAEEPWSATVEVQDELSAERTRREMAETTLHEGMTEERRRREEAERERDDLRRELYARREPRESPDETVDERQGRGQQPRSYAGGAQAGARRPWWRRMFRD